MTLLAIGRSISKYLELCIECGTSTRNKPENMDVEHSLGRRDSDFTARAFQDCQNVVAPPLRSLSIRLVGRNAERLRQKLTHRELRIELR